MTAQDDRARGGITLKDASDSSPISGLQVAWRPRDPDSEQSTTVGSSNTAGKLPLPPGTWSIELIDPALAATTIHVTVAGEWTTVWVLERPDLTLSVVDPDDEPIAEALVEIIGHDASIHPVGRTDPDGKIALGRVAKDPRVRLRIHHRNHRLTVLQVASLATTHGEAVVRLVPCETEFDILTETRSGSPVGGVTVAVSHIGGDVAAAALGKTDVAGRLRVNADWIGLRHHWIVGGAAYPMRIPVAPPVAATTRLAVARKVTGDIVFDRPSDDAITWVITDPDQDTQGGGLMFRTFTQPAGTTSQTCELPSGRAVRLRGLVRGATLTEQTVTVEDDGWQIHAERKPLPDRRRLHLSCNGARIVQVGEGESTPIQPGDPDRHAIELEISRKATSVQVLLDNGEHRLLVGQPGSTDLAITLHAKRLAPTQVRLVDEQGEPLHDVAVVLSGRSQLGPTGTDGWQEMLVANVHRLQASPSGAATATLPHGTYSISLMPPTCLDPLGVEWPATRPTTIEVTPDGRNRFEIIASAGRRIRVELRGTGVTPGSWRLVAGPWSSTFGGSGCEVWLPPSTDVIQVFDLAEHALGSARISPRDDRVVITVTSRDR